MLDCFNRRIDETYWPDLCTFSSIDQIKVLSQFILDNWAREKTQLKSVQTLENWTKTLSGVLIVVWRGQKRKWQKINHYWKKKERKIALIIWQQNQGKDRLTLN